MGEEREKGGGRPDEGGKRWVFAKVLVTGADVIIIIILKRSRKDMFDGYASARHLPSTKIRGKGQKGSWHSHVLIPYFYTTYLPTYLLI